MSCFRHLLRFNLARILTAWRAHGLMALTAGFMWWALRQLLGPAPVPLQLQAVLAVFCGNLLVFASLLFIFLLSETVFLREKHNRIMEAVFATPAGHNEVLLAKAAALALAAWLYSLAAITLAALVAQPRLFTAVTPAHLAHALLTLPALLLACAVLTGVALLRTTDIRVKNVVSTVLLFSVMRLSQKVMAVTKASGFLPVFYSYAAVTLALGAAAFLLHRAFFRKEAILGASY